MKDIQILEEIQKLTTKGVSISFYNCERSHLHHTLPYEAKYLEDVHIRIYTDSTCEMIENEIVEAKRNLVILIKNNKEREEGEKFDMKGYSDLYKYLFQHINFTQRDIDALEK